MNEAEPKTQVRELTKEELQALTDDLQVVLEKHGAEMGVTSSINLMKRELVKEEPKNDKKSKEETEQEEGDNKTD